MKVVQNRVVLQYGPVGSKMSESMTVCPRDAELFVALDHASGGYPYSVPIAQAHDFKTIDKARQYAGHWDGFRARNVTVTYEVE